MMYKDFFSTVTLAGAYEQAVRSAIESDLREKQKYRGNRSSDTQRKAKVSLLARLKKCFYNRQLRQTVKTGVQTPAE